MPVGEMSYEYTCTWTGLACSVESVDCLSLCDGLHVLLVQALDDADNLERAHVSSMNWTVDTIAPVSHGMLVSSVLTSTAMMEIQWSCSLVRTHSELWLLHAL